MVERIWRKTFQFSSVVQSFLTLSDPWTAARQASLSITNSQGLPKPMSIELVVPSNHLILCCPLLLLPSIFPRIRIFSNESTLRIRWPKYWSFSFNISPSNEHPGLISFRMDLPEVQGTIKSLLQHHSSKASILQCSAFFIVQLSHPYMTPGKTITLTRWISVGKIMSLLFNMLSRVWKIHWRRDRLPTPVFLGFLCGSAGKESACNVGDLGSISGLGRSPGEGNGYPLQYSGLKKDNV